LQNRGFLGHQPNLAVITIFEQIIVPSNLNIFARFKGEFNMYFSLLSNTKTQFLSKNFFCEVRKLGQTEISSLKYKYFPKLYRPINGLKGFIHD